METFNDGCERPVRTLNSFQMTGASENNTSSRRRAKKPSLRFVCFCFLCEEFDLYLNMKRTRSCGPMAAAIPPY
ncbi:Uncharacterized protein APZ42_034318 [Daphnia magna]|uniref:Uncharacterized protein n=1 Tax=Daphnia magna TaxID=35525 RepID=A0A0P6BJ04_9CRUS|nr:Uncharacterized protein APZ42_034318 [Daphnia magna]